MASKFTFLAWVVTAVTLVVLNGLFHGVVFITHWRAEPVNIREAMRTGALFFFATSATWNIANMATFVHWSPVVSVVNVAWRRLTGWLIAALFNRRWKTGLSAM